MGIFRAAEVIKLGIEIEKNGRDYYEAVAAASKDGGARGVFEFLAGEELKHEKVFESMLSHVEEYEPQGTDAADYYKYLKALSEEHVFTEKGSGKKAAALAKNDSQAVDMAIGFEKDSIELFTGMRKLVTGDGQKTVDKLIQQEQEHLLKLQGLKKGQGV